MKMLAAGFALPFVFAAALFAQHGYTQFDVENGRIQYQNNCIACHGANGDSQPGVDLGHGKFRRATSDDDIVSIITHGIPGTGMPPANFTESQAITIVAYLRSMAALSNVAVTTGDPVRGKQIFDGKAQCLTCHRVRTTGSRVGPDLTEIGMMRRPVELQLSLTDPDAEVLAVNRYYRVVTRDGQTITGRLLNEDTFSIQLLDTNEKLRTFKVADLREHAFIPKSTMPSYKDKLTPDELADVIGYLVSLKGL